MMVKLARTICMATCLAGLATSAQATLTAREESIVPIAVFAANGNEAALRGALKSGLEKGLSINEIRSILEQMYAYAGFPRSLTGLGVFVDLLQERRQAGIEDVKGREASPMKKGKSIREIGTKTQTALIGKPASSPIYDFSPNIDTYLKEHLFGEIFANDLLTWRERELATIAALAALPAPRQLRSHLNVCLNIGVASDELKSFADIVQKQIDHAAGKLARDSVEAVLEARRDGSFVKDDSNRSSILTSSFASVVVTTACMGIAAGAIASGDVPVPNPFGLVYRGAITTNETGHVNIHPVSYMLNALKIAANVYTPAGYDAKKTYPAVVVAHPNGGVKEQVAGLYAQRLAELGYVAIAADAAYQGASEGQPRHTDKPQFRTEDIHGMADFISNYPGVDPDRLGAFGICGGGGYTLNAAKSDKRFKAIATLSMFNSGEVRRDGYMNTGLDTIAQRQREASRARAEEVKTGKIAFSGTVDFDALTDESIKQIPTDLYREGMVYYGRTHRHPNSTFTYTTSSLMDLMAWDARDRIELIDQPLLMIAGEKADSLYMTEEAFAAATGTKDKELFKIPGATHIKTYFVPEYVDATVSKLKAFFGRTL